MDTLFKIAASATGIVLASSGLGLDRNHSMMFCIGIGLVVGALL